ncbi:SseB protein N-terminal domain-containing protein [Salinihabitans flavidus]|uniref:SseB protein N-terminal domain-containing protein n=1 Tax=Salinihabitans flavidus TaxID=569882 RepID=A0A1H8MR99_9RHOB|nr:SseB family protein [Salinihabitans flavidus]SEO19819.1 SseB protein N-terminal domain-containing protein [Salinihabitans flavidus]
MTETPLDTAHAAMEAAPEDEPARLRFYERLADSELFLLLMEEARGDTLKPEVFDLPEASYTLAFDREERLAQFAGRPAPYAALPGRVIAAMAAGAGVGLGVNLDVAPSAILIPPDATAWLADTLSHAPDEVEARIEAFLPPAGLPDTLLTGLDAKLARAAGLARCAYLVAVRYDSGTKGHLLAIVDAAEGAEGALARAVNEALAFSGIEAGALDVGFFAASDPAAAHLAKAGLRFDLPEPPEQASRPAAAPGRDPEKPPILR